MTRCLTAFKVQQFADCFGRPLFLHVLTLCNASSMFVGKVVRKNLATSAKLISLNACAWQPQSFLSQHVPAMCEFIVIHPNSLNQCMFTNQGRYPRKSTIDCWSLLEYVGSHFLTNPNGAPMPGPQSFASPKAGWPGTGTNDLNWPPVTSWSCNIQLPRATSIFCAKCLWRILPLKGHCPAGLGEVVIVHDRTGWSIPGMPQRVK